MTYDPLQSYAALGPYSGIGNPYQSSAINPLAALNPLTANPLAGYQGIPQSPFQGQQVYAGGANYGGGFPQLQYPQLQYPQLQYPQAASLQNPLLQGGPQNGGSYLHPLAVQQIVAQQIAAQQIAAQQLAAQQLAIHHLTQHLAAQQYGLQQPTQPGQQIGQYPQLGQIGLSGQQVSPYGQQTSPFGQIGLPLAPQSWVGKGGQLGGGQPHPALLAQLTARALQAQGLTPGVGFQI